MTSHDNNPHESVKRSRAGPGVVSDSLSDGELLAVPVKNAENEPEGFLIDWRASEGEWLYAETFDSYTPLIP